MEKKQYVLVELDNGGRTAFKTIADLYEHIENEVLPGLINANGQLLTALDAVKATDQNGKISINANTNKLEYQIEVLATRAVPFDTTELTSIVAHLEKYTPVST